MDIAIPFLEKYGITYYNPQVDQWIPEMIEMERKAKDDARILFFVIDDQTRSIVSMIEVAYLVGIRRMRKRLILTITDFSINSTNILMTNELYVSQMIIISFNLYSIGVAHYSPCIIEQIAVQPKNIISILTIFQVPDQL